MTEEFTPIYYGEDREDKNDAGVVVFTRAEFYDIIYAAREAHIRFKRLWTQTWAEQDEMDPDRYEYQIEECNEKIAHFTALEEFLRDKYKAVFGVTW